MIFVTVRTVGLDGSRDRLLSVDRIIVLMVLVLMVLMNNDVSVANDPGVC